jgi:hypothetical protein
MFEVYSMIMDNLTAVMKNNENVNVFFGIYKGGIYPGH